MRLFRLTYCSLILKQRFHNKLSPLLPALESRTMCLAHVISGNRLNEDHSAIYTLPLTAEVFKMVLPPHYSDLKIKKDCL
jgi:hypothetical protein